MQGGAQTAVTKPLGRKLAIDGGFGGEYRVNLAHGLDGEWHVMQRRRVACDAARPV